MHSKMKKDVGKLPIFALALGSIIGYGCFWLPGTRFLPDFGLVNTIVGLILGAIMMLIIENNYSFLIPKFPDAGGEYVYVKKGLSIHHGFFTGWFLALTYIAIVAFNAIAIPYLINILFPTLNQFGKLYEIAGESVYLSNILISWAILILVALANIRGIKLSGNIQSFMVLSLFIIAVIFLVGLLFVPKELSLQANITGSDFDFSKVVSLIAIAPFLFVGFDCIPQAAEEFNFPHKHASKLAMLSILAGALVYIIMNVVTAAVYVPAELVELNATEANPWGAGAAVQTLYGSTGFIALVIILLFAIGAGVNGFYISSTRLILGMARDKVLPESITNMSEKYQTPRNAIIVVLVITLIMPFSGRNGLGWIVDMSSIGAAIAYGYTSLVAARMAQNWFIKFTGILGSLIGIALIYILLIPGPWGTLMNVPAYIALAVWLLLGIIIIFYLQYKGYLKQASSMK